MTRDQRSILKHRVRHEVNIDIRYTSLHPLAVSEYEARDAAVFANYNWSEFTSLSHIERAFAVAHYRMEHIIKSNVNEILDDYQKSKMPRHS